MAVGPCSSSIFVFVYRKPSRGIAGARSSPVVNDERKGTTAAPSLSISLPVTSIT